MLRRHFIMNQGVDIVSPPDNEIWYTSSNDSIINPHDTSGFSVNIVSNTYENGKGVITFDNPVTSIGESAFGHCTSLTSITIPNSVTSIEWYSFYNCSSLISITIPNSVTNIGQSAFFDCSSLKSITYNGTKSEWGNISKGAYWNNSVPATVVHCTDGDIEI